MAQRETSVQNQPPRAHTPVDRQNLALMGLYLGSFTGMYSETALNIALPQLSTAFGVDISLTQWFVVGYMLAIGLILPFSSLLTKWFRARSLGLFALGAFMVGALVSGFSNSFAIALAGRFLQGISTGIVLPLMFSTIMEVVPPHKIGSAMGTSALVVMVATVIGPTVAGLLIDALSWRWVFFSFALVLVVAVVFQIRFGVSPFDISKPRIDIPSVVLSCIGFGCVVFGAGIASSFGWLSFPVVASLVIGIAALAVYTRRQLHSESPILNVRVLFVRNFLTGCSLVIINFSITLTAMYVLPQLLQNAMGLDVAAAGLMILPGGVVNCLLSLMSGRIYDKVGARIPTTIGFAFSLMGALLMLTVTPETPIGAVVVYNIVFMIGVPLVMSPTQSFGLSSLPMRMNADGSAIMNTFQQVGGAIATALATSLMLVGQNVAADRVADASTALLFAEGSHSGYAFALALAALGLVVTLANGKRMTHRAASTNDSEVEMLGATARDAFVYQHLVDRHRAKQHRFFREAGRCHAGASDAVREEADRFR